jgi:hypothetical protein
MNNIGPTKCYFKASFDFDNDYVKSNKINLSQLKLFVENERQQDSQNASITTHADAVVDVNFDASYEVQLFDNGNDDVIEIESDESSNIVCASTTAINLPYAWSTRTTASSAQSSTTSTTDNARLIMLYLIQNNNIMMMMMMMMMMVMVRLW